MIHRVPGRVPARAASAPLLPLALPLLAACAAAPIAAAPHPSPRAAPCLAAAAELCASAAPVTVLLDTSMADRIAAPSWQPEGGADRAEPVVVRGTERPREEDLIGGYEQPEWTSRRRFARTRIYVLPEGQWEFEQWYRGKYDNDGTGPEHKGQTEISYGFGNRMQADLYVNYEREPRGPAKYTTLQPEFRYALGDWGQYWGNPTIYLEYKLEHRAEDVAEAKILFGDELAPGWHWGANLSMEQQLGGDREQEQAITAAVSHTVVDGLFSVGVEAEVQRTHAKGGRDDPDHAAYLGPSIQWRPTERTHVDVVPLFGVGHGDKDLTLFVVFGYDFGCDEVRKPRAPVSSKSR